MVGQTTELQSINNFTSHTQLLILLRDVRQCIGGAGVRVANTASTPLDWVVHERSCMNLAKGRRVRMAEIILAGTNDYAMQQRITRLPRCERVRTGMRLQ